MKVVFWKDVFEQIEKEKYANKYGLCELHNMHFRIFNNRLYLGSTYSTHIKN